MMFLHEMLKLYEKGFLHICQMIPSKICGGVIMHKKNPCYNAYKKRNHRKQERRRIKSNQCKIRGVRTHNSSVQLDTQSEISPASMPYKSKIPENFSIIENPEIVIAYFNDVIRFFKENTDAVRLAFDFSNVKHMTVDAIMYLMALIKFVRKTICHINQINGNYPKARAPRELFLKSGFLSFVSDSALEFQPDVNIMRIQHGHKHDSAQILEIISFVHKHSNTKREDTWFIYDLLMEMQANSEEHAYKTNHSAIFHKRWMMFVEDIGDRFKFTFLDVGSGICATIQKRIADRLAFKTDSEYIISALNGEFRTATRLENRGLGLPMINEYSTAKHLEGLTIVANKAYCYSSSGNPHTLATRILKQSLIGTLYCWDISKKHLREGG